MEPNPDLPLSALPEDARAYAAYVDSVRVEALTIEQLARVAMAAVCVVDPPSGTLLFQAVTEEGERDLTGREQQHLLRSAEIAGANVGYTSWYDSSGWPQGAGGDS